MSEKNCTFAGGTLISILEMGFAVSRFSTLTKLCKRTSARMSNFYLSALVLNDPSDYEFIRHMGEHMDELNRRTGEHFLFFSLIDPPESWGGAINPKYRDLQLPPSTDEKDRMMLYNFLAQVELDDVPLPGILLTSGDLRANSCVYIPTNTEVINDQLMALGDFCLHRIMFDGITRGNFELEQLISTISIHEPIVSSDLLYSIAKALQLVSAVREIDGSYAEDAVKCINMALERFPDKYDSKHFTTIASCLEHRYDPFTCCCNINDGSINPYEELEERVIKSLTPIDIDSIKGLDIVTKRAWLSYNSILRGLEARNNVEDILDRGLETSQYSAPFFKGLENELNLSIVQAMRKQLGIPMPEYYAKYYPNGDALILRRNNGHKIDLNCAKWNSNRRGDLESVSIGNVRGAYLEMADRNMLNCFDNNREFCNVLYQFSRQRATLHAGYEHEYELNALLESNQLMNDLFVPHYLSQLIEIKEDLLVDKNTNIT